MTVTNAAIIGATTPVLTALAAALFLGEALSWKNWAGVALILAGVLLVAMKD